MDIYSYFDGRCSICGDKTEVRHKNIWLIGSEGTDMCWPCEKAMLRFLENRKHKFIEKRLEEHRKKVRKYLKEIKEV
jgi:hypothetical protein